MRITEENHNWVVGYCREVSKSFEGDGRARYEFGGYQ